MTRKAFTPSKNFQIKGFWFWSVAHEIRLHGKPTFALLSGDRDEVQFAQALSFSISLSIHPSFGANSIKTQLQAPKQSCRQRTLLLTLPHICHLSLSLSLSLSCTDHQHGKNWLNFCFLAINLQTLKFPWITSTCHRLWEVSVTCLLRGPHLTGNYTHKQTPTPVWLPCMYSQWRWPI